MNQDKRTLLPGLSLFVCFCLLTGMEKLITHFNLPPSLMALGEIVCFGLALAMALPGMDRERFKQRLAFKMPRKGGWLLILFAKQILAPLLQRDENYYDGGDGDE